MDLWWVEEMMSETAAFLWMSCGVFKFFVRPCPMIIPTGGGYCLSVHYLNPISPGTGGHVTKTHMFHDMINEEAEADADA